MELTKINTFIFNWVDNNEIQVETLKKTFTNIKLNNRVEIFNNLTYAELQETVERLRIVKFDLFRYIVVVILDNKCAHGNFINTGDNVNVLIDTEILTLLKTNKSLANKGRFFVVQKFEDYRDSEDYENDNNTTVEVNTSTDVVQSIYNHVTEVSLGLEFSITANEKTANFRESPFIDILCEEFLASSTDIPMHEIYRRILKKIKEIHRIDVQFSTNQGRNDTGILGEALDSSEERDFV